VLNFIKLEKTGKITGKQKDAILPMCQTSLSISSISTLKQKTIYKSIVLFAFKSYTKETSQTESLTMTPMLKTTYSKPEQSKVSVLQLL